MAGIGNKLIVLDGLKAVVDDMASKIGAKLAAPTVAGMAGQVLTAKGDGTSEWKIHKDCHLRMKPPSAGSSTSSLPK